MEKINWKILENKKLKYNQYKVNKFKLIKILAGPLLHPLISDKHLLEIEKSSLQGTNSCYNKGQIKFEISFNSKIEMFTMIAYLLKLGYKHIKIFNEGFNIQEVILSEKDIIDNSNNILIDFTGWNNISVISVVVNIDKLDKFKQDIYNSEFLNIWSDKFIYNDNNYKIID